MLSRRIHCQWKKHRLEKIHRAAEKVEGGRRKKQRNTFSWSQGFCGYF